MEKTIEFRKTYRYELINNCAEVDTFLYILHGYGQLAKYFAMKFSDLPKNIMIIAPEGMHRFYLRGSSGRVGASWMTKEGREMDIADNIRWLDALNDELETAFRPKKKILLGFSQGGSTAIRWERYGQSNFDQLIVWASDFPPEEKEEAVKTTQKRHFFIGTEDEYFDADKQLALSDQYKNHGFSIHVYPGKHDIDLTRLKKIIL